MTPVTRRLTVFAERKIGSRIRSVYYSNVVSSILRSRLSSFNVCADINLFWKVGNGYFESFLDRLENLVVLIIGNERDSQTLGTKSTSSSDTMKICVGVFWHIIVEDDVDSFNIHSTSEQVSSDQDTTLEILEFLVSGKTFLLVHCTVNIDCRKVLFLEKSGQSNAPLN